MWVPLGPITVWHSEECEEGQGVVLLRWGWEGGGDGCFAHQSALACSHPGRGGGSYGSRTILQRRVAQRWALLPGTGSGWPQRCPLQQGDTEQCGPGLQHGTCRGYVRGRQAWLEGPGTSQRK